MRLIRFIKAWTLPLAMLTGVLIYLAFAHIDFLAPTKPIVKSIDEYLTPMLIFMQLLITFCKVNPKELRIRRWHIWLLTIQLISSSLVYIALAPFNTLVAQGALICFICPTATAAAVITGKLGGNAESLISYTMLINIVVAIYVPTVFPIINPQEGLSFLSAFLIILSKVFPLLIFPFIVAQILRYALPAVHRWTKEHSSMAFYIWAVALAMVMGKTAKSIVDHLQHGAGEGMMILYLSIISLLACAMQFILGKYIGTQYNDRISGGQALGQKNTVLAIWMAYTYLNPVTSVTPGAYVFWQNIFNSWQLYRVSKGKSI